MSCTASFLSLAQRLGARLLSDIEARDGAHLLLPQPSSASFDPPDQMIASRPPAKPEEFTKAAAARLRAGLRAVAAYWRRVVLALALQMEHVLTPDQSEYVTYARPGTGTERLPAPRFRVLDRSRDFPSGGLNRPYPPPMAGMDKRACRPHLCCKNCPR